MKDVLRNVYELAGINDLRDTNEISRPLIRERLQRIAGKLNRIIQDEKLGVRHKHDLEKVDGDNFI
jgi:hypothetical protein